MQLPRLLQCHNLMRRLSLLYRDIEGLTCHTHNRRFTVSSREHSGNDSLSILTATSPPVQRISRPTNSSAITIPDTHSSSTCLYKIDVIYYQSENGKTRKYLLSIPIRTTHRQYIILNTTRDSQMIQYNLKVSFALDICKG